MMTALISLEATVDDGNNYNTIYLREGIVNVSDLSCFYSGPVCPEHNDATVGTRAHSYGESIIAAQCGKYNEIGDIVNLKYNYDYFCREDDQEYAYRFNEYNRNDTQKAYPHFTNRTIAASSGPCVEHDQVGGGVPKNSAQNFTYSNGSVNGSILIPNDKLGFVGTTYIYRGFDPPPKATQYACGPRCIWMWAYKNVGGDGPKFYQCPITVGPVGNTSQPEASVPDSVARVAAASIALQGQETPAGHRQDWSAFQFYAIG